MKRAWPHKSVLAREKCRSGDRGEGLGVRGWMLMYLRVIRKLGDLEKFMVEIGSDNVTLIKSDKNGTFLRVLCTTV